MKCATTKFIFANDKELFFKIIVLSSLTVMVCLSPKVKKNKVDSIKINNIYTDSFGDFDKVQMANKPPVISKMISVLKPHFAEAQRNDVAVKIHNAFYKYDIAPQIIVAIIDTESSFDHSAVSSSGDLSLAQVNVDVWNKEFARLNLKPIDTEKLVADEAYSLEVMARILQHLKTRYGKQDRRWYARYHSKTKKHKKNYLTKLEARMKLLEKSQVLAMQ